MYKVIKILNNNVAIIKTRDNKQAIAMGNGLVFNKRKGDLISERNIEKLFCLKDEESTKNLSMLLDDIPLDFITTTYEIVDLAKQKYDIIVQDYIYVTLAGHIYYAYKRLIENKFVSNYLPDMTDGYPEEYRLSLDALSVIKENLNIDFPKEEAESIMLHFINAQGESTKSKMSSNNNEKLLEVLIDTIGKHNIIRTEKNQNFYNRLMIHMKYFIDRIDNQDTGETDGTQELLATISRTYPRSTAIIDELSQNFLNLTPAVEISSNEKFYLVIHIQRLIQEQPQIESEEK